MGYLAAYFYQVGVYSFFHIPLMFVQVGIENIIFSTVFTTAFIALIFLAIFLALITPAKNNIDEVRKPQEKDLLRHIILLTVLLPLLGLTIIFLKLLLIYKILFFIGTIVMIPVITFIPPLFKFPNEKTYTEKYLMYNEYLYQEKIRKLKSSDSTSKISSYFLNSPYTNYILLSSFMLTWMFCAFILGRLSYTDTTEYPIYGYYGDKYIVAGTYNDQLLMIKLEEDQKTTSKETLLLH